MTLWSDDPDYTKFLTRYEHHFHMSCVISGATGAQTGKQKAPRRAESVRQQWENLHDGSYGVAKKAAAVLECAEIRECAKNIADDPDLADFEHLLLPTDVGGRDRVDVPVGPSQSGRKAVESEAEDGAAVTNPGDKPADDWGGLDPNPQSSQQMLELDREEDPDDGVRWDDEDEA